MLCSRAYCATLSLPGIPRLPKPPGMMISCRLFLRRAARPLRLHGYSNKPEKRYFDALGHSCMFNGSSEEEILVCASIFAGNKNVDGRIS